MTSNSIKFLTVTISLLIIRLSNQQTACSAQSILPNFIQSNHSFIQPLTLLYQMQIRNR